MQDRLFFYKGRVALYAILKALELKAKDEIILPGFTCVVVPNAIKYLGAKPIYADINPGTYNIDPAQIEARITDKTRAVIAQHTFGIPAEMDVITEIARKYNLYVIEDSCHAIGSKYRGREVGTFGDAAFFSSQWSKPVTSGLGGWLQINNPALREKLETLYSSFSMPSLRDDLILRLQYLLYSSLLTPSLFWFAQNTYRKLSRYGIAVGSSTNDELECRMPSNYERRTTKWQEETITKKLNEIDRAIQHRRWVTAEYEKMLTDTSIAKVRLANDMDTVFPRYPVHVRNKNRVLELAKENRIEMGDWFLSPVHPNTSGWEKISYRKGMCPNAERACERTINLPTDLRIGGDDIHRIAGFINRFKDEFASISDAGTGA